MGISSEVFKLDVPQFLSFVVLGGLEKEAKERELRSESLTPGKEEA